MRQIYNMDYPITYHLPIMNIVLTLINDIEYNTKTNSYNYLLK